MSARLRRELGLPALAIYGIGGMLGGGIYALVGEVAGKAGTWSWLSFLLAMAVAAPTALTYAELGARHPKSGGEAWFCRVAFGGETLPLLVGWLVLFSGVVSMAALARAFSGYVRDVVPGAPAWALVLAFLLGLGALNLHGIRLTSVANVVCTIVESAGLVFVVVAGAAFAFGGEPGPAAAEPAAAGSGSFAGILGGAALAFYAFIGFEDMVNVAEEVREPRRAYPVAIPLALVVVGLLYALVSSVATAVVPPAELAASDAPLTLVVARAADVPPLAFTLVALFAVANTALLNFVMASRLTYGMARDRLLPRPLAAVNARRRTPHVAIATVFVLACALSLSGGVGFLAGATSFLLLGVFVAVNAALARMRLGGDGRGDGDGERDGFRAPRFVPWLGIVLSVALALFIPLDSILVALGVLAAGLVWIGARRLASRAA